MKKFTYLVFFCCVITAAHARHFDKVLESINKNFNNQLESISGDISQSGKVDRVADLSGNSIGSFNQSENVNDKFAGSNGLKCFQCHYPNIRGVEAECRKRVDRCFPRFARNTTSCVTVTYEYFGTTYTFKDCFNKMPVDEGVLNFYLNGFDVRAVYKTCGGDLCNGSVKKNSNVFVITGVLFVLFKMF